MFAYDYQPDPAPALTLAPTILELNNLDHEYILFDCSTDQVAADKIEEINALAIKRNKFGIILARKGP